MTHMAGKNKGRFVTNTKTYAELPEYEVNVTVRIFDHFGLDVDDILKFGTANLVCERLPYLVQLALKAGNIYMQVQQWVPLMNILKLQRKVSARGLYFNICAVTNLSLQKLNYKPRLFKI